MRLEYLDWYLCLFFVACGGFIIGHIRGYWYARKSIEWMYASKTMLVVPEDCKDHVLMKSERDGRVVYEVVPNRAYWKA